MKIYSRISFVSSLVLILSAGGCNDDPPVILHSDGGARDIATADSVSADQAIPGDTSPDISPDTGPSCPTYTPLTGGINTDTTLDGCYLVEERINVSGGAMLTIAAGSVLMFQQDTSLEINADGGLSAVGTATAPILFTAETETRGFWRGIHFHQSNNLDNVLDYVIVEYGGGYDYSYGEPANVALTSSGSPIRVAISNSVLRHSGGYGFFLDQLSDIPTFAGNIITGNTDGAGFVEDDAAGKMDATSQYTGNDNDFVWVDADNLAVSQTWSAIDVPYVVDSTLSINKAPGITLTIEAGATLLFRPGAGIEVGSDGEFTAQGTAGAPITFDWAVENTHWRGIHFHNSASLNNILDHVVVDHAGSYDYSYGEPAAVALTSSGSPVRLTLTNSTLRNSAGYGFFIDQLSEVPSFAGNTVTLNTSGAGFVEDDAAGLLDKTTTFSGNTQDHVWVDADNLAVSQTWQAIDVPYVLDSSLSVNEAPGITLTIEAGATLLFRPNAGIEVGSDGGLIAQGTTGAPIVFDWAVQNTPWRGIHFHNSASASNLLEYVTVDHGGGYDFSYGDPGNIVLTSSGFPVLLTLNNSTIQNSAGYGVWVDHYATLTESGNTFSGNTDANFFYEP